MPRTDTPVDPYATPPRHHDRSGAVVRVAILALLLGGAGLGYSYFASHQQSADLTPAAEESQLAENTPQVYRTNPATAPLSETAPATSPESAAQTAAPAASPAPAAPPRRSSAPVTATPAVPPPTTSSEPIAPVTPPAG